jgi:hypothetical protein
VQSTNRTLRTLEWSTVMTAIHSIEDGWAGTPVVVLVDVSRTSVVPSEVPVPPPSPLQPSARLMRARAPMR